MSLRLMNVDRPAAAPGCAVKPFRAKRDTVRYRDPVIARQLFQELGAEVRRQNRHPITAESERTMQSVVARIDVLGPPTDVRWLGPNPTAGAWEHYKRLTRWQ